jgi:hypothetical protein
MPPSRLTAFTELARANSRYLLCFLSSPRTVILCCESVHQILCQGRCPLTQTVFLKRTAIVLSVLWTNFSTGDISYDPRHAACTYVSHRTHIDWNYHSRDILLMASRASQTSYTVYETSSTSPNLGRVPHFFKAYSCRCISHSTCGEPWLDFGLISQR